MHLRLRDGEKSGDDSKRRRQEDKLMLLRRFYHDALAQASYMVGCQRTGEALIVDPKAKCAAFHP